MVKKTQQKPHFLCWFGMFVLLFTIPFCFSGCSAFTIIHRIQDTKNFELKPVAEQLLKIINERDVFAFEELMSKSAKLHTPDLHDRIVNLFALMDGTHFEATLDFYQKVSSGGSTNGNYFEDGGIYFDIETSENAYILSITYGYYSEVSKDDIGISYIALAKEIITNDPSNPDYEIIFNYPLVAMD
jgi:hypothetical protein